MKEKLMLLLDECEKAIQSEVMYKRMEILKIQRNAIQNAMRAQELLEGEKEDGI